MKDDAKAEMKKHDQAVGLMVGCGALVVLAFMAPLLIMLWKAALR